MLYHGISNSFSAIHKCEQNSVEDVQNALQMLTMDDPWYI